MDWAAYEERISWAERSAIRLAPVSMRPMPDRKYVNPFFPLELQRMRFGAHGQVMWIKLRMNHRGMTLESANICFTEMLAIAAFELRHGFITSWPAFALLFHKMFGDLVLPWVPSLFLAGLAQEGVPRPQFDLEEVLNFHQCLPVASLPKYG